MKVCGETIGPNIATQLVHVHCTLYTIRFQFLRQELRQIKKLNKTTILITHVLMHELIHVHVHVGVKDSQQTLYMEHCLTQAMYMYMYIAWGRHTGTCAQYTTACSILRDTCTCTCTCAIAPSTHIISEVTVCKYSTQSLLTKMYM